MELVLNLTWDTICFTRLFMRSLGSQPWLLVPNSIISHFLPSFLLCTSGIFSSSNDVFQLQSPPLSLGPSHRLVLHSPTLSCHPPALTSPAASFFSTDLIHTGLGKIMLKPQFSLRSTPNRDCVAIREEPRIMTQSELRNQSPPWRQGPEICLKSMKAAQKEQRRIHVGDDREVCVLVLPAPLAADVPFKLSLGPSIQTKMDS